MEKRKKQPNSPEELLLSLDAPGSVTDEEYLKFGALLEHGRVHRNGKDLVLVRPQVAMRPRLKFRRTPLGMLPSTVIGALGLEELLADCVLSFAQPRCDRCGSLTDRANNIDPASWPRDGYVAVVVDGVAEEISLEEQCELLGAERAIVDGKLARLDDIGGRIGEPVINLADVSRAQEVGREIESWFGRGGGPLRLIHFISREAVGEDIQRVFKGWRCVPCGATFPVATRQGIDDAPACPRCRGEGWLEVEDDRFLACEDCEAYGCVTPLRERELGGVRLSDLATRPIREIFEAIPQAAREPFKQFSGGWLADYPFGASVDLLSQGEKTCLSILSGVFCKVSQLSLVVDLPSLGATAEEFETLVPSDATISLKTLSPSAPGIESFVAGISGDEVVTLRDLHIGPLSMESLLIPRGQVTLIQGDVGSGKTLMLLEIARRFAKRRKLAHQAAFGDLKRCQLIRSGGAVAGSLVELLGIGSDVASEMARLRTAQERGLGGDDFTISRSKYLCVDCGGMPSAADEVCDSCQGALFDSRVGGVALGNRTFAEIMRLPLSEVGRVFWASDSIAGVIERLPESIRELSLSTSCREMPPGVRRFVEIFAPIAKALSGRGNFAADLLLIDTPLGTSAVYQGLILATMKELVGRGATIVCAGVPKDLENAFASVVQLRGVKHAPNGELRSRYFDARMARRSEIYTEG